MLRYLSKGVSIVYTPGPFTLNSNEPLLHRSVRKGLYDKFIEKVLYTTQRLSPLTTLYKEVRDRHNTEQPHHNDGTITGTGNGTPETMTIKTLPINVKKGIDRY